MRRNEYEVTMTNKRFLRLWFGLFWLGVFFGWLVVGTIVPILTVTCR